MTIKPCFFIMTLTDTHKPYTKLQNGVAAPQSVSAERRRCVKIQASERYGRGSGT